MKNKIYKRILEKILCIFILLIMLSNNFLQVAIFAEENSVEVLKKQEETADSNSTQEVRLESDVEEATDNTTETPNTQGFNNELLEEKENEDSKNTSDEEVGEKNNEIEVKSNEKVDVNENKEVEGKDIESSNTNSVNQNINKENMPKNSDNVLNVTNFTSDINTENLLEVKTKTKEDIQKLKEDGKFKTKNNNYEIKTFETQFLSGASKDINGNLVWTPKNSSSGHEFSFRVNYAFSGLEELPAESVQITIPKSIIRNRDGNLDDTYVMSLPTIDEYEGEGEFVYKEDGDYLVIYNADEVEAGLNGYFEVAYATKSTTFSYKDYDTKNTKSVKEGGTASDPFYAVIALNVKNDTLYNISEDKDVFINTTAKITSTQKRYPIIYREWNDSWGEKPADAEEYYYLVWEISSYIGTSTQKYNFVLEDLVKDESNFEEEITEEDYQLVGYKLAGEKNFTNKNEVANQQTIGYRYDYVLTKHKKSTYMGKNYKLKNTITATLEPIDKVDNKTNATSSNTFNWDISFDKPTGSFDLFKYGNNNWRSRFGTYWDYANYDLEKMQEDEEGGAEVNELKGFKYFTEIVGYAYPWTLKEGGSTDNYQDYGLNYVTYDTWDDSLYLEDDEKQMSYNDYYLDYLTYSITNKDAEYDDFYNKFNQVSAKYEKDETIVFYAKFEDKNEWIEIGEYNLNTNVLTKKDDRVSEMTTSKITFKDSVHATGWRFITKNKHYYTNIQVTPWYVLTNSDYVQEKIKNKSSIKIKNNVSTEIKNYKEEKIFEKTTSAYDYARVTYYDSDIRKAVTSVSNKVAKKKYIITWKVNAWETATSGNGESEYIAQNSGKFYDLIPLGAQIDLDSIQVQTDSGFLSENEFSYELIQNYNKSGRTMLIVTIDEQAKYYNVYYTTELSWDNIIDYGRYVLNPVAYETGNEKITNGFADDGGNLSFTNKLLYNDFDKTTNAKKFLYAENTYNINALTSAVSGLYKKVKNSKEADYSYNTEVEPGETYSYKLRFQNTYMSSAKNLIFFDSLENFKPTNTDGTTNTSGWRGTLKSIDITQLKEKGIDTKIYISTIENLNIEKNNDINNTAVWKKISEEDDLSSAKAIAIDMTKDAKGNDYILNSGDSVTAVLYMEAPQTETKEFEKNQYSYNNVYIQNTLIDEFFDTVDYFIHQDYTTVKYRVVADVKLQKVNSKDENEGIKGITFRLYGKSIYGTEVNKYITSGKAGYITFKSIEAGEYILQEYEGTSDWIEDHTEHTVKINVDKTVYIDGKLIENNNITKITNTPRAHANVILYKKDLVDKNKPVQGVKFKLSGTSDYGNEVLMYSISDSNGKVIFENIEKGKYELKEVETITTYTINTNVFRVIVDENNNYDIQKKAESTEEYESIYENGRYNIYNEPHHSFYFIKKDYIDKNKSLEGVTFKLTGISDYGTKTERMATSDAEGKVTFKDLEKGIYTFVEESTISGYILNQNIYTVKIDELGNFEITGDIYLEKKESGEYQVYNEPLHNFYFVKEDSYNYSKLGGAKFRLYGRSNYGNVYDRAVISVENTGYVTFDGLESGIYFLQEIEVPITDNINYKQDTENRIVEVRDDGRVILDGTTIWPIDNDPYIWYNKRNKGQVTVTKKWIDNKTNAERQEPTIYISTKKPENYKTKAYFRTADETHSIIDYVTTDDTVTKFEKNTTLNEKQVIEEEGVQRLDKDFDNKDAEYKIYGYVEDNILYWWTNADLGVLPANLDYYFNEETSLKDIDWKGIYKNGYWIDVLGRPELTESITNMQKMFYNCTAIENLNIEWFNNLCIEDEKRIQYLFGNNTENEGTMTSLRYITVGGNLKLFDTSLLPKGTWKNQSTNKESEYTSLIGILENGTYEYVEEQGMLVKYAVQIYGINQDEGKNDEKLGLTFGPAVGENYNNKYVTHEYEKNDDGTYKVVIVTHTVAEDDTETIKKEDLENVTRTEEQKNKYNINLHEMTWEQIAEQSKEDPTVFTDAMLCGDTKSVKLNLNDTIAIGLKQTAYGDGAGTLYRTIKSYYLKWNPSSYDNSAATDSGGSGSNGMYAGGYSSSHIRATLIGENDKTNEKYAGDKNLIESNCLYSCIESDLRNVITAKKVSYVTKSTSNYTQNSDIYDNIWLFSDREIYGSTNKDEGLGKNGDGYDKFGNSSSKYKISTYSSSSNTNRVIYNEKGITDYWWLRSFNIQYMNYILNVSDNGLISRGITCGMVGLSFGFCLE